MKRISVVMGVFFVVAIMPAFAKDMPRENETESLLERRRENRELYETKQPKTIKGTSREKKQDKKGLPRTRTKSRVEFKRKSKGTGQAPSIP